MRKSLLFSTVSLIAFSVSPAVFADDLQTIVITATRLPTPETQVASSITLITAEDIAAKQYQTLPDALSDVPGLNVVQEGGPGGQTSVFMRGTNSNHVKVLVDGIDVGDPSSPSDTYDFGQFLTPDIGRIEVLRGPQSGLYGSDAIGGVINIITKSGDGPLQVTAGLEGGSFDTFNQNGGISGSSDGFHYAANIAHDYVGATPVTPLDLLAPGEKRNDDRYDNVTASTKLGYDVTDNFDLGLVARYTNSHLAFTSNDYILGSAPDPVRSDSETLQYYTRVTAHLISFGGFLEQTLGYNYGSIESMQAYPYTLTDYSKTYYHGERNKIDYQANLHFSDGETFVFGAEHSEDQVRTPIADNIGINSVYGELQSNLFENFYDTVSLRYDDNSRFGSKVTYRIAPTYMIASTGTKLEASLGSGFKAPTLSELYQSFPPSFFANPDLKPETSTGFDVGFEQPLFDDAVRFGATYFQNNIRNLIEAAVIDPVTFAEKEENVGRAKTDGIESFIAYQPIDSVTLRADYTFTEANDEITDRELLRRPKHKVSVDARWQATPALSFDANVLYASPWIDGNRDFSIPRLTTSGYTTVDVAAGYDISDQFTVYGRVTNLFDESYQEPVGFLRPGRGFFAGIKAKI